MANTLLFISISVAFVLFLLTCFDFYLMYVLFIELSYFFVLYLFKLT